MLLCCYICLCRCIAYKEKDLIGKSFPPNFGESSCEVLLRDCDLIRTTMKTAIMGLMLGMLAVGGLIAGSAFMTGQAYAQPVNAATASNSDDDSVTQSNSAEVSQSSEIKCKASVDDNDGVQTGDNTNTAANDCDNTQEATVTQANVNEDNDYQTAIATACQSSAVAAATNLCGNTEEDD